MTHVCTCAQDGSLGRLREIAREGGWPYVQFPFAVDFVQENLPAAHSLIVLRADGHPSAVVDGVIHDIFDPSEGGTAKIVGYWRLA
ncbi:MAG TPA: hypothetical protein VMS84_07805 [Mycobacterium sp.]|jgi:hypothetical protein|nr:hypothetical protein [Mycobacterium sp.]